MSINLVCQISLRLLLSGTALNYLGCISGLIRSNRYEFRNSALATAEIKNYKRKSRDWTKDHSASTTYRRMQNFKLWLRTLALAGQQEDVYHKDIKKSHHLVHRAWTETLTIDSALILLINLPTLSDFREWLSIDKLLQLFIWQVYLSRFCLVSPKLKGAMNNPFHISKSKFFNISNLQSEHLMLV